MIAYKLRVGRDVEGKIRVEGLAPVTRPESSCTCKIRHEQARGRAAVGTLLKHLGEGGRNAGQPHLLMSTGGMTISRFTHIHLKRAKS